MFTTHELELGPLRFSIIGAGRLGRVLGAALAARGLEVVAATSATAGGRDRASSALQVPVFEDISQAVLDSDVVFICVPDGAVADVAAQLAASATLSGSARVVHTSGIVTLQALHHLHERGITVLGLHPLVTVTERTRPADLEGAGAAITAGDEASVVFGNALAHALEMHPFPLSDEHRVLYHAAATMASSYTVSLMGMIRDLARVAGLPQPLALNAFGRLARSAIDRAEDVGPEGALTGPVVRQDTQIIDAHLQVLESSMPHHARLYRALMSGTVELAVSAGALNVEQASALQRNVAHSSGSDD